MRSSLCAFARNIDVVRRLSFAPSANVNELNTNIYDYWVSQESATNTRRQQTPFMKSTTRTKSYQQTLYESMFTAYDVRKVDEETAAGGHGVMKRRWKSQIGKMMQC